MVYAFRTCRILAVPVHTRITDAEGPEKRSQPRRSPRGAWQRGTQRHTPPCREHQLLQCYYNIYNYCAFGLPTEEGKGGEKKIRVKCNTKRDQKWKDDTNISWGKIELQDREVFQI